MPQQYSPSAPNASLESSAGSPSKKLHWAFDLQACKDFFFLYRKLSATSGTSATVITVRMSKQLTQSILDLNYACQRTGLFQDKIHIKYTELSREKNLIS